MRKTSVMAVVGTVVLLGLWSVQRTAVGNEANPDGTGSGLQRFAGTSWTLFFPPGLPPLPAIITGHPDGTFMAVDGSDEGLGGLVTVNSPALGVYKQTGPHQTTGRSIYISYEDTMPVAAFVSTGVSDYFEDGSGGTGVTQLRRYDLLAGENPTDPEQGTPFGDPVPYQFFTLTLDE